MATQYQNDLMMEDLMRQIDEEEAEEYGAQDTYEQENFKILNQEQANYFLGKYKEAEKENEAIEATAKEALDRYKMRVEGWVENATAANKHEMERLKALLESYAKSLQEEDPKKKTFKLINGSLAFRKQPPEFQYDDGALCTYLQLLGDKNFLKETVSVNKAALKKAGAVVDGKFTINGEEVPGIKVTEREPKFSIS